MPASRPGRVRRRLAFASLSSVALATLLVPGVLHAADPAVVTGTRALIDLPTSVATVGRLDVGPGTWIAHATLTAELDAGAGAGDSVRCALQALGTANLGNHTGRISGRAASDGYTGRSSGDLDLASSGHFGSGGGAFVVKCAATEPGQEARRLRIVARRVDDLTVLTAPDDGLLVAPAGADQVLVRRSRSAVLGDITAPLVRLRLLAGSWWVHASLQAEGRDSGLGAVGSTPICELASATHSTTLGVRVPGHSSSMVPLDLVTPVFAGADRVVELHCGALDADAVRVGSIRLIASRLGRTTLTDAASGTSVDVGSGSPRAFRVAQPADATFGPSASQTTLLSTTIPEGTWVLSGTARPGYEEDAQGHLPDATRIECSVVVGRLRDRVIARRPADRSAMSFSLVVTVNQPTTARLQCVMPGGHQGLAAIRGTGLSIIRVDGAATDEL